MQEGVGAESVVQRKAGGEMVGGDLETWNLAVCF